MKKRQEKREGKGIKKRRDRLEEIEGIEKKREIE